MSRDVFLFVFLFILLFGVLFLNFMFISSLKMAIMVGVSMVLIFYAGMVARQIEIEQSGKKRGD